MNASSTQTHRGMFSRAILAALILALVGGMLLLNAASWFFPVLASIDDGYGLAFSLSDQILSSRDVDVFPMPWWQSAGAAGISGIPLLFLAYGLVHLWAVLNEGSKTGRLTSRAPRHLELMGISLVLWTLASFLCEPVLWLWTTWFSPDRMASVSINTATIAGLAGGAAVVAVARLLGRTLNNFRTA